MGTKVGRLEVKEAKGMHRGQEANYGEYDHKQPWVLMTNVHEPKRAWLVKGRPRTMTV